jgi:hypothetical protein
MPSIGDLIFVALLGLLAFTSLSVRLLGDAGIGWHIRTGQLILATHSIPKVDPFSSSMIGQCWFAWEWFYDVLTGWLDGAAGLNGVVLLTAVIIALVFFWVFRLMLLRGANIVIALLLVLLAASASMIHFFARPHMVSWLFAVAWFWILESSEGDCVNFPTKSASNHSTTDRLQSPYLLPLLMLVWVNMHGGFLIGFALLAIYWLSAAWMWLRLTLRLTEDQFVDVLLRIRARRRVQALTWAGILSAAATFINPYGYRLHVHIYRYLSNRFLMEHIEEFQSPNFHLVAQKCFAVLLLLTLVALAANAREIGTSHLLVVLFAVFSGLGAARNIPIASLLLILVIAPWLSDAMARAVHLGPSNHIAAPDPFLHRMRAIELNLQGHRWPIIATALACFIALQGGKVGSKPVMNAHFDVHRFPAAAVNYVEKQSTQGPALTPDYWGGYFIYRLYPRMKVVVDDRHDFYAEEFLKSYLKMIHIEPGWQDFLRQHPAQFVVMPKNSAVANILLETAGWQPVYRDDVAVVFVQTSVK